MNSLTFYQKQVPEKAENILFNLDYIQLFLDRQQVAPTTRRNYERDLGRFEEYLKANNLIQPTEEDIIAYVKFLRAQGLQNTTIKTYHGSVKRLFDWTESVGLYPNIAKGTKGAKVKKGHKKDYFTSEDIKHILSKIERTDENGKPSEEGLRDYAIILLMVTGGLRTIEVSRANIKDIDKKGNTNVLYVQSKGDQEKSDFVRLAPPVQQAILDYLLVRPHIKPQDPLFVSTSNNSKGKRITTRTVSGICKKAFRRAGYDSPRLTAHSLRHTSVTLGLIGGQDITEVQEFARHANIETTMIYNHEQELEKNKTADIIADMIMN